MHNIEVYDTDFDEIIATAEIYNVPEAMIIEALMDAVRDGDINIANYL